MVYGVGLRRVPSGLTEVWLHRASVNLKALQPPLNPHSSFCFFFGGLLYEASDKFSAVYEFAFYIALFCN